MEFCRDRRTIMFSIISVDSAYHSSLFQMFSKHEFNFSNEDKLNKKSLRQRGKWTLIQLNQQLSQVVILQQKLHILHLVISHRPTIHTYFHAVSGHSGLASQTSLSFPLEPPQAASTSLSSPPPLPSPPMSSCLFLPNFLSVCITVYVGYVTLALHGSSLAAKMCVRVMGSLKRTILFSLESNPGYQRLFLPIWTP